MAAENPQHTNRIHTGSRARPGYWVRSSLDHYALAVEETGDRSDPGGTRQRAEVRAYTPARRGEGALGKALWRDSTAYATWSDNPIYLWEESRERVWIITTRLSKNRPDELRLVSPDASGTWQARALTPADYGSIPADIREAAPEELRKLWTA